MKNDRDKIIVRASVIGILANVFLAGFKAFVGLASNSVAIVTDAVNNLSDAGSSIITIVGTKLSGREADKKHPFGYGRIEYLSAMVISMLVLYAGITALIESVKKIIHPATPDYSVAALIIVAVAVLIKVVLGLYVSRTGAKVNSDPLINSGKDALLDSVISLSTLVAAGVFILFDVSLEAWLGVIISAVIIKSGIGMLAETLSKILGEQAEPKLVVDIKKTINSFSEVRGAYDLVLHDYGPDSYNGSVHVEVPDTISANELDKLIRNIQNKVYQEHNVLLTGIGIYSFNTKDPAAIEARENVRKIVTGFDHVVQMHGFYIDTAEKTMRFDIVVSFDAKDRSQLQRDVMAAVSEAYPDYSIRFNMDIDFSEIVE